MHLIGRYEAVYPAWCCVASRKCMRMKRDIVGYIMAP